MESILISSEESKSLKILLEYFDVFERKHYEESDYDPQHIYLHIMKLKQIVNRLKK